MDVLLSERVRINGDILQAVKPLAEAYGVRVLNVGIKDVILAPRVRDLLMKEAEAKRVAQRRRISRALSTSDPNGRAATGGARTSARNRGLRSTGIRLSVESTVGIYD